MLFLFVFYERVKILRAFLNLLKCALVIIDLKNALLFDPELVLIVSAIVLVRWLDGCNLTNVLMNFIKFLLCQCPLRLQLNLTLH